MKPTASYLPQNRIKSSKQNDYGKSNVIRQETGQRTVDRKN